MFERTTKEVRIDKSDCSYVDIIHTNGGNEDDGFLGINAAVGHADYYPNGGHKQPKCNNNFVCSHGEAPWIWIDSGNRNITCMNLSLYPISVNNGGCNFGACASESDYDAGKCDKCRTDCNKMGWESTKPRSNTLYYGNTRDGEPYC